MEKRLKHQLQGFIETPPLWEEKYKGLQQFTLPKINFPEDLCIGNELPELASNFVLGKRMECFFRLIISKSSQYELLSNNIQISRDKITLGELDFLLKDLEIKKIIHLELVFKFYVYDPTFSREDERWIGPNRRDSFKQKLKKLQEKQFPLLHFPETREYLQSLNLNPQDILQQTCFKAKLFLPKYFHKKIPELLNQNCIAGYWINLQEFKTKEYQKHQFFLPPKQDWPATPKMTENWIRFSETLKKIEEAFQKKKSPLLWMKKTDNKFERFFVVWW